MSKALVNKVKLNDVVSVKDFGAVGDGVVNDTTAVQTAITAAAGRPLHFPAGTYRITSTLTYSPASYDSGVFGAGLKIIGDGIGKTYFDNQANGALFSATTGSTAILFQAALGCEFDGFTIKRSISTTGGVGIYATTAYNLKIRQVHIIGMSSHGIQIPCILGDPDGSNMIGMEHVRIENCAGWGVKADGDSGRNEISFIYMRHVFIQACGTASVSATPPSGGMIWKGQILTMQQCAFTLSENCALFIPGQAGAANVVDLQSTTFENNKVRGLFCTGISLFKGRNLQFYNNDTYTSTTACEFDGASFTVAQVDIDGVYVRATAANNAYTAFKISGGLAELNTCRIRNVTWNIFDYAGQTRFNGWQFDPVEITCDAVTLSTTTVRLRPNQTKPIGNSMPLRLRGGNGGTPSTTGEWVSFQVPNTGLNISNASLAISTRYYLYMYDNANSTTIELSTTVPTIDTATGYPVKTGDATRTYCGSALTDASGLFVTSGGGWLNPTLVSGSQPGVYTYLWTDSTNRLRVRYVVAPTSDTDGTVVGTQT